MITPAAYVTVPRYKCLSLLKYQRDCRRVLEPTKGTMSLGILKAEQVTSDEIFILSIIACTISIVCMRLLSHVEPFVLSVLC